MIKPDNCLDNLKNCNAGCCKVNRFHIPKGHRDRTIALPFLTEQMKYYFKIKNFKVSRLRDRRWSITPPSDAKISWATGKSDDREIMIVENICPALKDNKCSLHGTSEKPLVCERFGNTTTEGYYIPKKCIYSKTWEQEMSESLKGGIRND